MTIGARLARGKQGATPLTALFGLIELRCLKMPAYPDKSQVIGAR
jgi:hypothetical protein